MTETAKKRAVFLDRDGTIIEDRDCVVRIEDIVFLPGVKEALRILQTHFSLIIITNQPWISRGHMTWQQLEAVQDAIFKQLASAGVYLLDWYACPHTRDYGCECIKPKPALGKLAAAKHGLDLKHSWTIGDHPHDVDFARSVRACGGIYLLTGHGTRHLAELDSASYVASDLLDAAGWLARNA